MVGDGRTRLLIARHRGAGGVSCAVSGVPPVHGADLLFRPIGVGLVVLVGSRQVAIGKRPHAIAVIVVPYRLCRIGAVLHLHLFGLPALDLAIEHHPRRFIRVEVGREACRVVVPGLGARQIHRAQRVGEDLAMAHINADYHIVAVGGVSVLNLSCARNVVAAGHLLNHSILVFAAIHIILRQIVPGSRCRFT